MVIDGRGCQVAGTPVYHARGGPWAYGVDGNGLIFENIHRMERERIRTTLSSMGENIFKKTAGKVTL